MYNLTRFFWSFSRFPPFLRIRNWFIQFVGIYRLKEVDIYSSRPYITFVSWNYLYIPALEASYKWPVTNSRSKLEVSRTKKNVIMTIFMVNPSCVKSFLLWLFLLLCIYTQLSCIIYVNKYHRNRFK